MVAKYPDPVLGVYPILHFEKQSPSRGALAGHVFEIGLFCALEYSEHQLVFAFFGRTPSHDRIVLRG